MEIWGVFINVFGLDNFSVYYIRGSFQSCCLIYEDKIRVDKGIFSGGVVVVVFIRGVT